MATLDWSQCSAVESVPGKVSGAWVFRDTRLHGLVNGESIAVAETAGFWALVTTDKNIQYQQNLTGRKIAFVVLGNQQWPILRRYVDRVVLAADKAIPGSFAEVEIPFQ